MTPEAEHIMRLASLEPRGYDDALTYITKNEDIGTEYLYGFGMNTTSVFDFGEKGIKIWKDGRYIYRSGIFA